MENTRSEFKQVKLSKNKLRKLINEVIVAAMSPRDAKRYAINLIINLDHKLKYDRNIKPYYQKLYTLIKPVMTGRDTSTISDESWENSNQALYLIDSIIQTLPSETEEQQKSILEYQALLKEIFEMYDVFYPDSEAAYDEKYRREKFEEPIYSSFRMEKKI